MVEFILERQAVRVRDQGGEGGQGGASTARRAAGQRADAVSTASLDVWRERALVLTCEAHRRCPLNAPILAAVAAAAARGGGARCLAFVN